MKATAVGLAAVMVLAVACGESRHPIGEECIRDEDCLSQVCAARSCVSAPTLISGGEGVPEEETPHLPAGDAAAPSSDASSDGS